MGKRRNVPSGTRFGRVIVIKEVASKNRTRQFLCFCDCGNECEKSIKALFKKGTSSCGCYHQEYNNSPKPERRTENYGHVGTRLYETWQGIKKRCYNKNSRAYKWYGAKGVKVCNKWKNRFLNFHNWAHANGYRSDLTIDRIDPNGDYEPSNCKWIPWSEQNNNKTNSRIIEFQGELMTTMDLSRRTGVKYTTIIGRLNRGLSVNESVS